MPESLEGQVQYWKEKYERSEKQCDKYAAQVGVLERIIDGALRRSCNGND
jgi:nucleoside-triphosphatase THEP1